MAASVSMSIFVEADDIDTATVHVSAGVGTTIPSVRFDGTDGTTIIIQGYHTHPAEFAEAFAKLSQRLDDVVSKWSANQTETGER